MKLRTNILTTTLWLHQGAPVRVHGLDPQGQGIEGATR